METISIDSYLFFGLDLFWFVKLGHFLCWWLLSLMPLLRWLVAGPPDKSLGEHDIWLAEIPDKQWFVADPDTWLLTEDPDK